MRYLLPITLICLLFFSCSKNSNTPNKPDNINYEVITQDRTFNLTYVPNLSSYKSDTEKAALEEYMTNNTLEVFEISSIPNKLFIFPDEISFYRHYRSINDIDAKNWIVFTTIEQIIESGKSSDFNLARPSLVKLKEELSITNSLEELFALTNEKEAETFAAIDNSSYRTPVSTFWEHGNFGGAELCIECEAEITTYGPFNCYTKAEIPNLTTIPKSTGGNWNDVASWACNDRVDGSVSMGVRYFRNINFDNGHRNCYQWNIIYDVDLGPDCGDLSDKRWCRPFGKKLNDRISGVRIKAIWQGCTINYDDF